MNKSLKELSKSLPSNAVSISESNIVKSQFSNHVLPLKASSNNSFELAESLLLSTNFINALTFLTNSSAAFLYAIVLQSILSNKALLTLSNFTNWKKFEI